MRECRRSYARDPPHAIEKFAKQDGAVGGVVTGHARIDAHQQQTLGGISKFDVLEIVDGVRGAIGRNTAIVRQLINSPDCTADGKVNVDQAGDHARRQGVQRRHKDRLNLL
jgi:hypothetical protein